MTAPQSAPSDSRYIPLTQQPACCVPTCFQMIMYRNGIPLIPAEEIGRQLGLVVHPDRAVLFYRVRTDKNPPPAGYGTQISKPEYEPNVAFKKLGIPLKFSMKPISEIKSPKELLEILSTSERKNTDVLLCFNQGSLMDDDSRNWGHVVVFDRLISGQIRIVDPAPEHPKWRSVDVEKMFTAMQRHGEERSAGVWFLDKV